MIYNWTIFIDLAIISLALLIGTLIRSRVRFFQRFLIPNSLTAGILLVFFYNFVAKPLFAQFFPSLPIGDVHLKNIVYHFLNIAFISLTLRKTDKNRKKGNRDIFATATALLSQYAIQSAVGLGIVLILILTVAPNLFPGIGLLPTLGFSLGPGPAFSLANGWEEQINQAVAKGITVVCDYKGVADLALTFSAMGFLWACFGGVFLINFAVRKGWVKVDALSPLNKNTVRSGVISKKRPRETILTEEDSTNAEAIDPLTFNLALVFTTYALSYILLRLLTWGLSFLGKSGAELGDSLWSMMFIFSTLVSFGIREVMQLCKIDYLIDNTKMTRISGVGIDFMVAAAIGAISLLVVKEFWMPIVIMGTVIGVITIITHIWLSARIFTTHVFYRAILVYGCATGTISTGMALLRILDPTFESPASKDYMYAAGIVFTFALPILVTAKFVVADALAGNLDFSIRLLAMYMGYIVLCFISYLFLSGKKRFAQPKNIWLKEKTSKKG